MRRLSAAPNASAQNKGDHVRYLVVVAPHHSPPDADVVSTMLIDITYTVKDTNDPRNLVFPFYVIPAEEGSEQQRALPETTGSTEE